MRPRRKVLLLANSEVELSRWRFVLETRGYRVLAVLSLGEALRELEFHQDCVVAVAVAVLPVWVARLSRVRTFDGPLRLLLADVSEAEAEGTAASVVVLRQPGLNAVVLDRLRMLAHRKPGPKPPVGVRAERGRGVEESVEAAA